MSESPFELRGLDHVVLRCTKLDETLAFYRDTLGCALERTVESVGLYQLRAGASLIDLVPVGSELGGTGTPALDNFNVDHFCLQISDTDWEPLRAYLHTRGVSTSEPARRYGAQGFGESVYLSDPEGNTVELKQSERSA